MNRDQALREALTAARKAEALAIRTEEEARLYSRQGPERYATAGVLWAETSRAFSALAQLLPEPEPQEASRV